MHLDGEERGVWLARLTGGAALGAIFENVFSGANAPLAKALHWCQWLIVTPIDLEANPDLHISSVDVRKAIHHCLTNVSLISGAMVVLQSLLKGSGQTIFPVTLLALQHWARKLV